MAERKKILIVSYYFAPQNVIGAVRATKLAKYLSRMGHEVTVLCGEGLSSLQDPTLKRDLEQMTDVHTLREWNPMRSRKQRVQAKQGEETAKAVSAEKAGGGGMKRRVLNGIYLFLLFCADMHFAWQGVVAVRRMGKRFDVVLTSYGPWSMHQIGRKVKKQGRAARWIADFRDVVEAPLFPSKRWVTTYVAGARKYADQITGVSTGYLETMGLGQAGRCIPNGFDREDLQGIEIIPRQGEKQFRFVYCGQMYGAQRDLRAFFRGMKELAAEGVIGEGDFLLEHAGKPQDGEIFSHQATECGLEANVRLRGMLPRDEAIRLQLEADAILIAAWNTPECCGNLPGKLLEVLMMERPLVCCTTGTIPESESAKVIRQTETGYCYEEAAGEASFLGLKAYLRGLCEPFRAGKEAPFAPNRSEIEKYTYAKVAERFAALMQGEGFDG